MRILLAAFLLLFLPCFVVAQDKTEIILKQLTEIQKSIDTMNRSMDARTKKLEVEVASIQQQMVKMRAEIEEVKRIPSAVAPMPSPREDPKPLPLPKVEEFEKPVKVPFVVTSRVVIHNTYPQPVSFTINGLTYSLRAGASGFVEIDPGDFRFQVKGAHENPQTRNVSAGESFSMVIYSKHCQ